MPNLEVTYNGLWSLWQEVDAEIKRIEAIDPKQRHMSDKLSYPLMLEARSRYWRKITTHELWAQVGKPSAESEL